MGHAVSKQGKAAGEKQQKAAAKEQTPAEIIADIRTSVEGALYVPVHRIAVLLSQYDLATVARDAALAQIEGFKITLQQNAEILKSGADTLNLITAERDKALARIEELLYVNGDILRKLGEQVEKNNSISKVLDVAIKKSNEWADKARDLEAKNEEFRQVYEAENSSQSLTIERSEE